jgi:hypothetical protein
LSFSLFIIAMCCCYASFAQASIHTTGGDAVGSGGSVAYSVGQMLYTSETNLHGSVHQGVQHAFEIFTLGAHEVSKDVSLIIFPNPTSDQLVILAKEVDITLFSYQLIDAQGRLVLEGPLLTSATSIGTGLLQPATYFLHVFNQNQSQVQLFKVVKH